MKKFMQNLIVFSLGTILGILPFVAFAKDNCSFGFGSICFINQFKLPHADDKQVSPNLLITIKNAINWCLRILATIVLCFCLYGGFLMLTSGADSKGYSNGRKVLKNALIGLTIILLAWMIVSVVFWFVTTLSGGHQTQSTPIEPLEF